MYGLEPITATFGLDSARLGPTSADDANNFAEFGVESRPSGAQLRSGASARACEVKTRRSMAASMHIVAKTVGPTLAAVEVLPFFEAALQDGTHEVRHAALRNVAAPHVRARAKSTAVLRATLYSFRSFRCGAAHRSHPGRAARRSDAHATDLPEFYHIRASSAEFGDDRMWPALGQRRSNMARVRPTPLRQVRGYRVLRDTTSSDDRPTDSQPDRPRIDLASAQVTPQVGPESARIRP